MMNHSLNDESNNQLPLVSICIPAYNAERFIAETLESALSQDYPFLEIVVSDDCSKDRTVEIVKAFENRGVKLICQEKNLGMWGNMNAVIRPSTGKYVCKLDADDLLEPEYISSMVPVMEAHPRITFAHCACRLIDVNGNYLGHERSIHGSFIREGLKEWPRYVFGLRAVNIVILRRSAFDAVGGYDSRFKYSEDWKMARDLLKIGDVYYNDRVLASYRVHDIGKMGVRLVLAKDHLIQLEDMELNWPPGVPGKKRLLHLARRRMALSLARSAAFADQTEAEELLRYLPLYGDFMSARLLLLLIRLQGSGIIRTYYRLKSRCRQAIKRLFYRA